MTSIDFPFVAFVPREPAYYIESTGGLKRLLAHLSFQYVISANPGWHKQLGIGVSAGGHYQV